MYAGHTHCKPGDNPRKKLALSVSHARAKAVMDAMVQGGASAPALSCRGYGGTQPVSKGGRKGEKAHLNRRVEINLKDTDIDVDLTDSEDESSPTDCKNCGVGYDSHSRECRVCAAMYCVDCKKVKMKKVGRKMWVHPACGVKETLVGTGDVGKAPGAPPAPSSGKTDPKGVYVHTRFHDLHLPEWLQHKEANRKGLQTFVARLLKVSVDDMGPVTEVAGSVVATFFLATDRFANDIYIDVRAPDKAGGSTKGPFEGKVDIRSDGKDLFEGAAPDAHVTVAAVSSTKGPAADIASRDKDLGVTDGECGGNATVTVDGPTKVGHAMSCVDWENILCDVYVSTHI